VNDGAAVGQKVRLTVADDTVTIQLVCNDGYTARVLFEDIREHIATGRDVILNLRADVILGEME